ncbi:hypothetical protein J2Y38_000359 [Flavobacterium sp. 2755]|nr:hypothetical protein [Flavobacterium sp. 2755]
MRYKFENPILKLKYNFKHVSFLLFLQKQSNINLWPEVFFCHRLHRLKGFKNTQSQISANFNL